jgi:hypothetical protein
MPTALIVNAADFAGKKVSYNGDMKHPVVLVIIFLSAPQLASAQTLIDFFEGVTFFFQFTLLPFLFAFAFLFFVIGLVRFLIAGAGNEESRNKGKALLIWSIIAFVIFTTLFGLVNLIAESFFGFGYEIDPPEPDYLDFW